MQVGTNQSRVGVHNRAVVLDAIRRDGPVSRAVVGQRTGLTAQTVTNIAGRLLAEGLVRESGSTSGLRGAPGRLLELDPTGCFAVGVHLDPAHLAVVVLDLAGEVLVVEHLASVHFDDPGVAIEAMADAVGRVLERSGVDRERVLGIGVGVPGPIDPAGQRVESPAQLRSWKGVPLAQRLGALTGLPVHLEKDGVANALGELWAAGAARDFISVYLGHGIGAAIVVGGEVVRGTSGNAGEFGGMPVFAHGGWTELWSACQPLPQVRRGIESGLLSGPVAEDDATAVRRAYEHLCGLANAAPLLVQSGIALGSALARIVELLDVETVVVGGSAALAAGPTFLDALTGRLAEQLPQEPRATVRFTTFGEDAVARGAACAVLQSAYAPSAGGLGLPLRAVRSEKL